MRIKKLVIAAFAARLLARLPGPLGAIEAELEMKRDHLQFQVEIVNGGKLASAASTARFVRMQTYSGAE
jgi:hypothetical protein